MRVLTVFLAAVLLVGSTTARGQALPECSFLEDWLLPPLTGQLAVAQRVFSPPTDGGPGVVYINSNVAEFTSTDLAAAAFTVSIERMRSSEIGTVREGVGTHILAESVVFVGEGSRGGAPVAYAQVLFRDGHYVHSWQAATAGADPVPVMFDIIRRLLARGQLPAGTVAPSMAPDVTRLFDQLPEATDVPSGLDLVDEGCGIRRDAQTADATPTTGPAASVAQRRQDVGSNRGTRTRPSSYVPATLADVPLR